MKSKNDVKEIADMLELEELLHRKPFELSGGQRQRVAMGRAMVRKPSIFLFDEPLSNLDAKLRTQMRTEMKLLHQKVKSTIIYVTHDQVEAMTLADRIVVMNDGYIEQVGEPIELFEKTVKYIRGRFHRQSAHEPDTRQNRRLRRKVRTRFFRRLEAPHSRKTGQRNQERHGSSHGASHRRSDNRQRRPW